MPISNIRIINSVLKTDIGMELTDASGIILENVQLNTTSKNPIVVIENSFDISLKGLKYDQANPSLLQVKGAKSKVIRIADSNIKSGSSKISLAPDVTKNAVTIK